MAIFNNLSTDLRKLYKIVIFQKYLHNKLPLSLTKPDKQLQNYIGKPQKHIMYASSQL